MSKEKKFRIAKLVLLIILFVVLCILVIISLKYSSSITANSNVVSMISGFWSAGATAILGFIAVWQNKRYKKLSDESSQRMEQLTIVPECYLSDITTDSPNNSIQCKIMIPNNEKGIQYYLHLITLNLPMMNISISKIILYTEASKKAIASYSEKDFLTNFTDFNILQPYSRFAFNILLSNQFNNADIVCEVTIQYQNIYGNTIFKPISFSRKDLRNNPRGDISKIIRSKAQIKEEQTNGQA